MVIFIKSQYVIISIWGNKYQVHGQVFTPQQNTSLKNILWEDQDSSWVLIGKNINILEYIYTFGQRVIDKGKGKTRCFRFEKITMLLCLMDRLNFSEHSKIFLSNNVDNSNSASNDEGGCPKHQGHLRGHEEWPSQWEGNISFGAVRGPGLQTSRGG